ncbi:unnamed protein product [Fraxinus pennsylvanica]|uniref:hydroxymethylglutaryl-CoA reductase (NADPH) n=1 Tax=Fraxinus pennsylvanica TaxID=56036 RepID=A0AAD2E396_9LAMI|nr:unnamed protein product [Fraxinus pennsylvanica]
MELPEIPSVSEDDEELVKSVVSGKVPSYSLESKLGDCFRAAKIRRDAVQRLVGRSLEGLPLEGFDYDSILGQCCEMPVGYVQIPVGIAGPLLLNGCEYSVPMATTEGCLVASTNRGCKAILASGGATCVLLRDAMTRAPVVRFTSAKRATELKFFLEDPLNFDTLSVVFSKSSRFSRLQGIKCAIAGKNLYIRFSCSTGDAMGMNMVSKGVQNVLDFLQNDFPDMDVIGISGNFCSDKKPAAVNWIEGRGKSVVCEAIITRDVVTKICRRAETVGGMRILLKKGGGIGLVPLKECPKWLSVSSSSVRLTMRAPQMSRMQLELKKGWGRRSDAQRTSEYHQCQTGLPTLGVDGGE